MGATAAAEAPGAGNTDPRVTIVIVGGMVVMMIVSYRKRQAVARWTVAAAKAADRATAGLRRKRTTEVAGAARVAAEDDPVFAAERVIPDAEALFRDIQTAWDGRDLPALERMVTPDLMVEWRRRLDDFAAKGWHNRVVVKGPVGVEYVGSRTLAGEDDDRVVVRISATLDDYVVDRSGNVVHHDGSTTKETGLREYWTLARNDEQWVLISIEQDREGRHNLTAPIIADPAYDPGMADQVLVDQAVADRIPDGMSIAEVADLDFSGSPLAAARDMALNDDRFDPGVIEVAARRAVAAG
ncbi:MAG: TIM44-like domain-containing protein [Thermoleophilia bacterium]